MKILFTEDNARTHHRARALRGGLIKNYHNVITLHSTDSIPSADLWFHGITSDSNEPLSEKIQSSMEDFKGKIVFFGNDDSLSFPLDRIHLSIQKKASLFLRSVWPSDHNKIDPNIREKTGFVNPFLKPTKLMPGKQLKDRPFHTSFFGAPLTKSQFTRINALRMIKAAGFNFKGGLYKNAFEVVEPPEDLLIKELPLNQFMDTLKNSRLNFVLHGNNPLSFRLFESLATRSLAIVQDLSSIKYLDCDLKAGIHYVSIREDLADLVEKTDYYLKNLDEAQQIADAGFKHFKKMFHYTGVDLPQPLYERMTDTWKVADFQKRSSPTPLSLFLSLSLPYVHSL